MIRFLMFLLGKQYETCKSCDTLKQQLALANEEKKELTDTLLSLLKPKVYEATPVELQNNSITATTFSKRRAALEARSREEARILSLSKNIGRPDGVEKLEQELGIESNIEKEG